MKKSKIFVIAKKLNLEDMVEKSTLTDQTGKSLPHLPEFPEYLPIA